MRWQRICAAMAMGAILLADRAWGTTFNITNYGAKSGDGSSDWSAIESAVSAAQAGDTVLLPAGNFNIDKTLTLKNGVTLAGAGSASTVVTFSGGTASSMIKLSGNQNIQIASITFDGNNASDIGEGITADTSSNLNIHDTTIRNIPGTSTDFGPHAIYFSSAVTGSTVSNDTFSNIGTKQQWGAGIRLAFGSSNDKVLNNTISNTGRGGILADDDSENLIIMNNKITGSGQSLVNGTGLGIEVWKSPHALIQNNTLDHWISVDSSDGTAVRGNRVSDTTGVTKPIGLEVVGSNDVVVSRNTVDSGSGLGISESNNGSQTTSRTYLAHNMIKSSSTWGIQLLGGPSGTTKQYFYADTFTQTAGSTGNGFRLNGNASNIVLDNSTIDFNGGAAIEVTGTNLNHLVFKNNSLHDNSGATVTNTLSGADVEWAGNTVANNGSGVAALTGTTSSASDPKILLSPPKTITAGSAANFSFAYTAGSANSPLANVLWDFDDGLPVIATTATGASYTFATPGTYTVGLVAWDSAGRAAHTEVPITVTALSVPEPAGMILISGALLGLPRRSRLRHHE